MNLSNDLITQFVKVTNDKTETKEKKTVYATAVVYDEKTYVKIDGSDLLTPVDSTVSVKDGERVTVTIEDHKATIIGNHTDPSASSKEVKQIAEKFTWIVKSGDSISTMELTDEFYSVVSKNITLTADRINLNGYISNEGSNWSIDNEGNFNVNDINIEGELTCEGITFKNVNNPKIMQALTSSVELLVNADTGSDEWEFDDILESYDEAEEKNDDTLKKKFKSIQGAIDAIPKFINNKNVYITLETNTTEDLYIRGVSGGAIRIYMNAKTLYGWFKGYSCSATLNLYGGTRANPESAIGVIHPNIGLSFASRAVSFGVEACLYAAMYNIKVYAPDSIPADVTNTDKVAVGAQAGVGSLYCSNVQIVNATVGFRANNSAQIHVDTSSGMASKYGFQSATGGKISFANKPQAGGKVSATDKGSGGQIWYDEGGPTFESGNETKDPTTAPPVASKSLTAKSSYGDTYRLNVYTGWKKDGTVRQGDYGYGDCIGCWFFGNAFAEVKGKDISKVTITISRQRGGTSSAVGLVVKTHNYSSRPSGAPTMSTTCGTLSLATNTSGTLTITDATVLANIKAGKVKGFGIQSAYNKDKYAVCSGSVTVKITYKE